MRQFWKDWKPLMRKLRERRWCNVLYTRAITMQQSYLSTKVWRIAVRDERSWRHLFRRWHFSDKSCAVQTVTLRGKKYCGDMSPVLGPKNSDWCPRLAIDSSIDSSEGKSCTILQRFMAQLEQFASATFTYEHMWRLCNKFVLIYRNNPRVRTRISQVCLRRFLLKW